MAWTVNFKACKRCSSGEYWLVSSRFTNTVHPVAAGSPCVALQTLPDALEPWEGGEGSQNAGENSQQAKAMLSWLGAPACAWLPAQGRAGCRAEPRWGLWHWAPAAAPGAVPSVPRVTQVGLDCEGNSAMSSPEASPAWPASTPGCSPPLLQSRSDGEGAGQDLGLLPHHPPPTPPF